MMRYQHATRDADKAIARALDVKVKAEQDKATKPASGRTTDAPQTTKRVRVQVRRDGGGQADRAVDKPARTERAAPPAFGPLFLAAGDEGDEPDDGATGALVPAG
jgi:hypothetical protein